MSMVANLNRENMTCWCPACGEIVDVDEGDFNAVMSNSDKEYYLECPNCGQSFYAAESYNDDTWEVRKYAEGINSKFKVGQRVYAVVNSTLTKHVTCPACNGEHKIKLKNGQLYDCPECYGLGFKTETEPEAYRIAYRSTVGKVQVVIYEDRYEETYMIKATGVGSGQVWKANDLFATKQEAEEYCKRMNNKEDIEIDAVDSFGRAY